jgi:hypothetical protein
MNLLKVSVKLKTIITNACKAGSSAQNPRMGSSELPDWRIRARTYLNKWDMSAPVKKVKQTPLKIALIGPGIMPILLLAVGAVEQLIWDYACFLKKQGHTVRYD